MAQKKSVRRGTKTAGKKRSPKPGRKRYRRTESELIADYQKKIEELKTRATAREFRRDPSFKSAITAHRALTKAEALCRKSGYIKLANALKAAHLALKPHLQIDDYADEMAAEMNDRALEGDDEEYEYEAENEEATLFDEEA